jgi:excinuclease ABC subunit A
MRKSINILGARENNLQNVNVVIPGDKLTVITGVSGSGKSSLAFDTLYHEARRRFLEIFSLGSSVKLAPAEVESISGLGPAVAVGQNVLNRNPLSTLATASGLHPFLRLLYSNFGVQHCPRCGKALSVLTEDEIVEKIVEKARQKSIVIWAPLLHQVEGSHKTLLELLVRTFGSDNLMVDKNTWENQNLDPHSPHDIEVKIAHVSNCSAQEVRALVHQVFALGSYAIMVQSDREEVLSRVPVCTECGTWFKVVEPKHFHMVCDHCQGTGCESCHNTGLHPQAAAVTWFGMRLPDLLQLSVDEAQKIFDEADIPESGRRLEIEIKRRLHALKKVGLGYITLNRSSPTVSRGEAQRIRLAITLTSRLEDMVHILDEPTIGQHPYDVAQLLPAFRELAGPVVFVEHDRVAASEADYAIDLGPGAGCEGGKILFTGTPSELWKSDTPTGRYFSFREKVKTPEHRRTPTQFLGFKKVHFRNLKNIDVFIPKKRLTVVTGVSGSGKSTLIDVLVSSLQEKTPVGCEKIEGLLLTPVLVDQSPIGKNPRSNPSTYTKLSDIIRDLFACTGLSPSHFSFNRPEGACPVCKGMGALEVKMRYLPSTWIVCDSCGGKRFSDEVLSRKMSLDGKMVSIADFYRLSIDEAHILLRDKRLSEKNRKKAKRILEALKDVGLGYLTLGQPSPTLSGGEAQRVKLAKYLGSRSLSRHILVLDEPSTGLHPQDISGLLTVLDRLVRAGGTVVVVEHNTDIVRAADWVIDLGPGAGPKGGELVFSGPPEQLMESTSLTGKALQNEVRVTPRTPQAGVQPSQEIVIRNASAHNLKNVNIDIPKNQLVVVTGVSGSGKSSLVIDVLEAEARRRFLESLSMYERQSTREGPEAPVDTVSGLGVAVSVGSGQRQYSRRSTIGTNTEILHHITVLLAYLGERKCECGSFMVRRDSWVCPQCHATASIAQPTEFLYSNWHSVCPQCQGVGTLHVPRPEKLIVNPENPLCAGAMYSPGFFPKGYLCKPFNYGYSFIQALGQRYNFDPDKTPWNKMSHKAQHAFLFGDPEPLDVTHISRDGRISTAKRRYPGFYGWVRDWDIGGTYTEAEPCPECRGGRLRPEFLAVTLKGYNIHQLSEMPLSTLYQVLQGLEGALDNQLTESSFKTVLRRLKFLLHVGLGYIHLDRVYATLSAGEAERVNLAGILGSRLTSLTVLLDEPSRGLHPSEVDALLETLRELRDEGNTIVVVEHDPVIIRNADYIIDMGPGAGSKGGYIVAEGTFEEVIDKDTVTGVWLRGERQPEYSQHRTPQEWMVIHGARENNLKGEDILIPLGVLVGVCGVSGSGKSTLLIDTVGRALAPKKITTSVAYEPMKPGLHDSIENAPQRVVLVDQTKKGIYSPSTFLGLTPLFLKVYAESEDAQALGLKINQLSRQCSVCNGSGTIKMDMGFLPAVYTCCDVCQGTGYPPEAWDVRVHGLTLPDLDGKTIDEVYEVFKGHAKIGRLLKAAKAVGLGYLVLRQPGYTLSGGEAQRLKIAQELCRKTPENSLYILDEPTVGQHLEDVSNLVHVLQELVKAGNGVVVVEHHPYVLAACDWLIEMGPGGGPEGGQIVACGTPENLSKGDTLTSSYLKEVLEVQL